MKQQDVATLLVIVIIAATAAFIVSGKFISPSNEKRSAHTVGALNADFPVPSSDIFNNNAINPSVRIKIAPGENNQPFAEQQ